MTSAPKSDSTVAAAGAAIKLAQSRTLRPSKIPFSIVAPLRDVLSVLSNDRYGRSGSTSFGPSWEVMQLLTARHQRCISAGRRRIDGHRLFGRKPREIMRPAGLGPGA